MGEVDFLQDEDEREDEVEIEDEGVTVEAVRKLSRGYWSKTPGREREEYWDGLSDDQLEALKESGLEGPTDIAADELDFKAVTLDDAELRRMDPSARADAKASFKAATKQAEAAFNAGLNSAIRGQLDISQATLDELAALRDQARQTAEPNAYSAIVQKGAALIDALKGPARVFDPGNVKRQRQHIDALTKRMMLTETDIHGNERSVELTKEEHPEQFSAPAETVPDKATVAEFTSWPYPKRVRFIKEHPEQYRILQLQVGYDEARR